MRSALDRRKKPARKGKPLWLKVRSLWHFSKKNTDHWLNQKRKLKFKAQISQGSNPACLLCLQYEVYTKCFLSKSIFLPKLTRKARMPHLLLIYNTKNNFDVEQGKQMFAIFWNKLSRHPRVSDKILFTQRNFKTRCGFYT